jgi:hypothetical protein
MLRRASVAIAACFLLLLVPATTAVAKPPKPTPIDVYNDFSANGKLTHVYPKDVLQSILSDASLNQYGDPLVMMRLRRAVRQQLAGVLPSPPKATTPASPTPPASSTETATTRASTTPATTTAAATTKGAAPAGKATATKHRHERETRVTQGPDRSPRAAAAASLVPTHASNPFRTRDITLIASTFLFLTGGLLAVGIWARR